MEETDSIGSGNLEQAEISSCSLYLFIFVLIVLMLLTVAMNTVLLVLLASSWRHCTSLNISLLSLALLNLITVINQLSLIVSVAQRAWIMGTGACHAVAFLQFFCGWAITLIHLLLSRDRHQVCKDPFSWQRNRKRMYTLSTVVWVTVGLLGLLERVLHYADFEQLDSRSDYTMCYWDPVNLHCSNRPFRLCSQLVYMLVFMFTCGVIYYTYFNLCKEIHSNERAKKQEAQMSSVLLSSKSRKTTSERAVEALVIMFTLHVVSTLPAYIMSIVRRAQDISHLADNPETTNPIVLLSLTAVGFISAISPLTLLFNFRFKQHVKAVLQCNWDSVTRNEKLANSLSCSTIPIHKEEPQIPKLKPFTIDTFVSRNSSYVFQPSITPCSPAAESTITPCSPAAESTTTESDLLSNGSAINIQFNNFSDVEVDDM